MILYTWNLNNRQYNLNNVLDRIELREDLREWGFFKDKDNEKYYTWFSEESIGRKRVTEIMNAVKLFTIVKLPKVKSKLS